MSGKTTLWTLNFAAFLLEPEKDEILSLLAENGVSGMFGDRTQFNRDEYPDHEISMNLMPFAEYFVPIVPKCVGSLFDSESNDELQAVRSYYRNTHRQKPYQHFWDCEPNKGRMYTRKHRGYYDILRETAPNILIGYSQGGLVARYLLWLADHVFNEKDVISGIVTLSSPNFGSPLANPDNISSVTFGFAKLMCILFLPDIATDRIARKIQSQITFEEICSFVKNLHTSLLANEIRELVKDQHIETYDSFAMSLLEVYNWLGGLRNDPDTAFHDLAITELNSDLSVISSVNTDPPLGKIRGIISSNNSFPDLLFDIVEDVIGRVILHELNNHFSRNKIIRDVILAPATALVNGCGRLIIRNAKSKKERIEQVINNVIMKERATCQTGSPHIARIISAYESGIPSVGIPARAHDFIIPSAYQITAKTDTDPLPENNVINPRANHLSGGFPVYGAGKDNCALIHDALRSLTR